MRVAAVMVALMALGGQQGVQGQTECTPVTPNQDHPIPDFSATLAGSFTFVVEMTSETQTTTSYVEERRERRDYHDYRSDTAAVSVLTDANTTVFHFYPDARKFIIQYGEFCESSGEAPAYNPWGWYDVDTTHGDLSYGPATILRLSAFIDTEFLGEATIEGVRSERWRACLEGNKVEVVYSFSEVPWSMPYANYFSEGDGRLPVQIDVKFMDGSAAWQYNVVEFLPYVGLHTELETPRGLACENTVGVVADLKIPDIPWHFSLAEEYINNSEIEGSSYGKQHLDKLQLTYAGNISMVSLTFTAADDAPPDAQFEMEAIHDFNTGVQYILNREFGNCTLSFIPAFSFDSHFAGFIGSGGSLLSPNALFHIDDSYAFVGERSTRSIEGDLYTSTRLHDIPDPTTNGVDTYSKAVLEYYFSQGVEVTPAGTVPVNIPLRGDLFVYNSSNLMQVVGTQTTNFYDFQEITLYSEQEFSVQECYERHDDRWTNLDIFFPATRAEQFAVVEEQIKRFKHELILQLLRIGHMSPVRLADIQVQDGVSGVIPNTTDADTIVASVRLLERAPYIFSYRYERRLGVQSVVESLGEICTHLIIIMSASNRNGSISIALYLQLLYINGRTFRCHKCFSRGGRIDDMLVHVRLTCFSLKTRSLLCHTSPPSLALTASKSSCHHGLLIFLLLRPPKPRLLVPRSFHHCGEEQVCFLSALNGSDGTSLDQYKKCRHWVYDLSNVTFEDPPSEVVYDKILHAINDKDFRFSIPYKEDLIVTFVASASLFYRTPDPNDEIRAQFTLESSATTIAHPDNLVSNITLVDRCLKLCVDWRTFRCETVVHLRREKQCLIVSKHYHAINQTELVPHTESYIYSRSYLVDYQPILGGVALTSNGPVYANVNHIETCAMHCSTETSIKCQSFEWCYLELACHLHQEHFLDVAGGGGYVTNASCIHYSKKSDAIFSQYPHQGMSTDKHKLAAVRSDSSSCAKFCLDDPDEVCQSFDFCSECHQEEYGVCGEENEGARGLCFLGTHHLGEKGLKLLTATTCDHYSRDLFGDLDYASWLAQQQQNDNQYTPGDMTWLAFGMIFLGILLAIGFLGLMVAYRPGSVPKDLSITYVNIKTSGVSEI
nr:uncharacterized protein LOC123770183 [Procambarus clarkii]